MGDIVRFPDPATGRLARPPDESADQAPEPLWRELVGRELHRERRRRGERLVDVAGRAGVSVQYLSEVERGLKDPSSEMLHAIAGALELSVRRLAVRAGRPDALALAA
ncbi:helix-turn-helix domain-containing protein [Nocardioides sp. zg-1228]|uniref:helix-turn-helix domain-containing protein n=1 Tax=Nocardioides sp. zg-1228 TaxID=2763008 RepID=UPI001642B9E5|nr:helix-turn-helix transcriptional regulator [Nocardioides sp. zg-1228]MBC2934252.1 helix-turn-helix transcriptional regulator [Nocardioides sp. zg-1228]QSF59032.1 helix-turn-helix transcriptional regulator [Nocardioides sp. zg-1228]